MILKKKLVEHGDKIHHEEDLGWEDQPFEMQEQNEIHMRIDSLVKSSFDHFGKDAGMHIINRGDFQKLIVDLMHKHKALYSFEIDDLDDIYNLYYDGHDHDPDFVE